MIFVTHEKDNRLAVKNEEKLSGRLQNKYCNVKGTLLCNLIWGRVFDCAGKGFGISGDIFTPGNYVNNRLKIFLTCYCGSL